MANIYKDVDTLWRSKLRVLCSNVPRHESRSGATKELLGTHDIVSDPRNCFVMDPKRKLDPVYAAAEFLWYMSGDDQWIAEYAPQYRRFMNHGQALGAYGLRWRDQLGPLIEHLRRNPESRQAVLGTWCPLPWSLNEEHSLDVRQSGQDHRASDLHYALNGNAKDIPCTLQLQFFLRNNGLSCICTMRSNDLWLGLPYDVFCFTTLQTFIAEELGIYVGQYQHQAGSLHLYEKNWATDLSERSVPSFPFGLISNCPHSRFTFMKQRQLAVENEAYNRANAGEGTPWIDERLSPRWATLVALCAANWWTPDGSWADLVPTALYKATYNHWKRACEWRKKGMKPV